MKNTRPLSMKILNVKIRGLAVWNNQLTSQLKQLWNLSLKKISGLNEILISQLFKLCV